MPPGRRTWWSTSPADGGLVPTGPMAHSYAYDGAGLRMAKTTPAGTTAFTWDHSQGLPLLLSEGPEGLATRYVSGPGGMVLERIIASGGGELATTRTSSGAPAC